MNENQSKEKYKNNGVNLYEYNVKDRKIIVENNLGNKINNIDKVTGGLSQKFSRSQFEKIIEILKK